MKPGIARDIVTITVRRRVDTTRSWKYEDIIVRDIPAQIEERQSAMATRDQHEGGEFTRVDAIVYVRPLTVKGVSLRDRMELTNRDGREFEVLSVWPQPAGVPLWWALKCVERRTPKDK